MAQNVEGERRRIRVGHDLFVQEEVTTNEEGFLKLKLLDDTYFTIGPDSAIILDEFIYKTETDEGQIRIRILRGVFRFITGKIAKQNPEQMSVELPVGIIGIRGTQVAGEAKPNESLVVKEKDSNGADAGHTVVLRNTVNGQSLETLITEVGHGSRVRRGEAPSPSGPIDSSELGRLDGLLMSPFDRMTQSGGLDALDQVDQFFGGGNGPGSPDTRAIGLDSREEQKSDLNESEGS